MKIKTSELANNALCYAVCMIEMPHLVWGKTIGIHEFSDQIVVPELPAPQCYSPFMDWAQGGPIIGRERIALIPPNERIDEWEAVHPTRMHDEEYGPTSLIAAMRCYVASKLGDEVEVPEGLN